MSTKRPDSLRRAEDRRAYLLGIATEAQRARIDDALFDDPKVHDELRALEQTLIDDYVADSLSPVERDAFEQRLDVDPRLKAAVPISQGLDQLADAARRSRVVPFVPRRIEWATRGFALASAAALALVVFLPRPAEHEGFRAKGQSPAVFRPVCTPTCVQGARLGFELSAPANRPFFAAFGRTVDGRVIWYEPRADQTSARATSRLWSQTFELDDRHVPNHDVFAVFSDRPMTRDEIARAVGDDFSGSPAITIFRRTLRVGKGE